MKEYLWVVETKKLSEDGDDFFVFSTFEDVFLTRQDAREHAANLRFLNKECKFRVVKYHRKGASNGW